ncbi:MAG TPA: hypothetical protein VKR53_08960 [Puia sp.]|nr:hypothetical protein [Puia sp.]
MKKIPLLNIFILCVVFLHAQSFYFIEEGSTSKEFIKQILTNSSQFIVETPIESEFRIKTDISADKQSNLTVKLAVVDSATFETIYYNEETYRLTGIKTQYSTFTGAINFFFEKNIKDVIISSKHHTFYKLHRLLKPGKDKTYHKQY